jgi:hypothetical protein
MYPVDLIPTVSEGDTFLRDQKVLYFCVRLPFSFYLKLVYHSPVLLQPVEKIETCFGVKLMGRVY